VDSQPAHGATLTTDEGENDERGSQAAAMCTPEYPTEVRPPAVHRQRPARFDEPPYGIVIWRQKTLNPDVIAPWSRHVGLR
jgi:hypothetical protein